MSNPLQQTIEALAKEKGIEPDVVISAIEEAVATASRKYYKTGENLKTRFNLEMRRILSPHSKLNACSKITQKSLVSSKLLSTQATPGNHSNIRRTPLQTQKPPCTCKNIVRITAIRYVQMRGRHPDIKH